MDSFRPQKSPGSDRFLGLLSSSPPSAAFSGGGAGFELDEHDIFSTDTDPNPNPNPSPSPSTSILHHSPLNPNPNSSTSRSPLSPFHRERNFGILAALPEDSKARSPNPKFLQRKPSISSASSSASTSPSSSARMIPVIPKPKPVEYGGKLGHHQYQSAPVNVPRGPRERGSQGRGEPLTTFSVLEGVGRTLKGRDLRRVRNAVWRKTGFLD
ncbi:early nodulin-20-like [Asparagus officinalis]|uniref:early nodulin-20-like n=1 Tax=Asparagus officinalis TaxID=4686 RepID=UPI00098E6AD3|nr:early nodulin-20-like [Asparagus officinalis]